MAEPQIVFVFFKKSYLLCICDLNITYARKLYIKGENYRCHKYVFPWIEFQQRQKGLKGHKGEIPSF